MTSAPRVKITDPGELADLQRRKRKDFEDNIRKNRTKMVNWTKYAAWEEAQKEYDRARYPPCSMFIHCTCIFYIHVHVTCTCTCICKFVSACTLYIVHV